MNIKGVNEFEPEFVMPKKQSANKIYTFKTLENKDFKLSAKAEDKDEGKDGEIMYKIVMLNQDDTFEVDTYLNETTNVFGKWLFFKN